MGCFTELYLCFTMSEKDRSVLTIEIILRTATNELL